MTFNVFITQPEMEEQGKSVFREDGWLPTTFILKAHHLFSPRSSAWGLAVHPLSASPTTRKQGWQGNAPSLAARRGIQMLSVSC